MNDVLKRIFQPSISSIVLGLITWQALSMFARSARILPPPLAVLEAILWDIQNGEVLFHVSQSMLRIIIGFGISVGLGTAIGVAMGLRKYWQSFFGQYITIGLTIPSLCWAVIGVMWLGINPLAPVFATVLITFPFVAVNIWEGVKAVDRDLVDMSQAFRIPRSAIVTNVYFPSLMPFMFAAFRFGFATSWKIVMLAELFGASNGIGYQIFFWYQSMSISQVLAWTLMFTSIMFAIEHGIFRQLEKRAMRWRPEVVLR